MSNYSTLAYNSEHAEDLQQVCKSLNMTQRDFLENAIHFFKQTGIDPRTKTDFRSETNRLIGFIKTQDKTAKAYFEKLTESIRSIDTYEPNSKRDDLLVSTMIDMVRKQGDMIDMMSSFIEHSK